MSRNATALREGWWPLGENSMEHMPMRSDFVVDDDAERLDLDEPPRWKRGRGRRPTMPFAISTSARPCAVAVQRPGSSGWTARVVGMNSVIYESDTTFASIALAQADAERVMRAVRT
jgi:hypothetical protein